MRVILEVAWRLAGRWKMDLVVYVQSAWTAWSMKTYMRGNKKSNYTKQCSFHMPLS